MCWSTEIITKWRYRRVIAGRKGLNFGEATIITLNDLANLTDKVRAVRAIAQRNRVNNKEREIAEAIETIAEATVVLLAEMQSLKQEIAHIRHEQKTSQRPI